MLYRSQLTCCTDLTDAMSIVIPITRNLISPYGSSGASSLTPISGRSLTPISDDMQNKADADT